MELKWYSYFPIIFLAVLKKWKEKFTYVWFSWKRDENKSCILLIVRIFYTILLCISLRTICEAYVEKQQWFKKYKFKLVELYVIIWVVTEILFLVFITHLPGWLVLWFFTWRLIDIFQSCFSIGVLSEDPSPYSAPRMLILIIIGLAEVSIIYAGFDYIYKEAFISNVMHFQRISESLYHSVTTLTTIGSEYIPVNIVGYSLSYSEIVFSILFLIVVIQRIVSLFNITKPRQRRIGRR
jgi:hypothetical protein